MRTGTRGLVCLLLSLLVLLCGGCDVLEGGNTEERLRPPRITGEQEALQQALDTYLEGDYILTYPRSGDHRAAFLFEDMDGDGVNEAACFYRHREGNTHLLVLRRTEGGWSPVSDVQGGSIDIDWVTWGDMRGDGGRQLLVGWGVYNNSRDRQVILYSLENGTLLPRFEATCAAVCFGDVRMSGCDDLLIYRIDSTDDRVTAELMAFENGSMTQLAVGRLDGHIRSFGTPVLAPLAAGQVGVFVDGYKDANSVLTELVYWDGVRLNTPFYDASANANTITARETVISSTLTSCDINGDGYWEWPQNRRLVGYQTVELEQAQWLTSWMRFDLSRGQAQRTTHSVVNLTDRYLLLLPDEWVGETADGDRVTVQYQSATHLFELREVENGVAGQVLLRMAPTSREVEPLADGYTMTVTLSDSAAYTVWYQQGGTVGLTPERIRYMLTALP